MIVVHQSFYASGFLFHSATQKILLLQSINNNTTELLLFGNKCHKGSDPQTEFQESMGKTLGMKISASSVHPIYDYTHNTLGEHFIFFIEVTDALPKTYPSQTKAEWFLLSKLSKLNMSEQTRHDIIVGERVIRSLTAPARSLEHPVLH